MGSAVVRVIEDAIGSDPEFAKSTLGGHRGTRREMLQPAKLSSAPSNEESMIARTKKTISSKTKAYGNIVRNQAFALEDVVKSVKTLMQKSGRTEQSGLVFLAGGLGLAAVLIFLLLYAYQRQARAGSPGAARSARRVSFSSPEAQVQVIKK